MIKKHSKENFGDSVFIGPSQKVISWTKGEKSNQNNDSCSVVWSSTENVFAPRFFKKCEMTLDK